MQTEQKPSFRDIGQGPAVVLLHDVSLTSDIWNKQLEPLQKAGFRLILPDFSRCQEHTSIAEYSRNIIQLLNRLGLGRVAVCGMGMGGTILFDLLEQAPQRIVGACFISTRPVQDDIQERAKRAELVAKLLQQDGSTIREQLLSMLFGGRERHLTEQLQQAVRQMVYNYDRNALISGLKAMVNRKDYTYLLDRLQLPTLVVGGEHDSICHPQHVSIMAARLPCCLGAEKLDAGHLIPLEQPQELTNKLIYFLRVIAPRREQALTEEPGDLLLAS